MPKPIKWRLKKYRCTLGCGGKRGEGNYHAGSQPMMGLPNGAWDCMTGWMDESEEGTEFISDRLRGDRDRIFFYSNCTGTPYRRCAGFLSIRFRLHAEVLYATYNASMVYGIICMRLLSNKRQGD